MKTGSKNDRKKKRNTERNYAGKEAGEEGSSNYQNRLEKRAKNPEVTGCLWSFVQVSKKLQRDSSTQDFDMQC